MMPDEPTIDIDDPASDDVRLMLQEHLAFAHEVTPAGHAHALDIESLRAPAVTFFSARHDGVLLGVGALLQLDASHAEIKSMHVAAPTRGRGVGRAIVLHIVAVARARGCRRVSLETGSGPAFARARALYASVGFIDCEPFASYEPSEHNVCMTLALE
jgi:putative acetyltransferase